MKREIIVIHADGMKVEEIEEILQSTDYRGFPVVRNEDDRTILGFIRKSELRHALGKSRRVLFRFSTANRPSTFQTS